MAKAYNFNFMSYRKQAAIASILLLIVSAASIVLHSLEWGLDFTGGTLVEVTYEAAAFPEEIRAELDQAGYSGHVVQYFGSR